MLGAGQTTIAAAVGVTIRARQGYKIGGTYGGAKLYQRAANDWVLFGDLKA